MDAYFGVWEELLLGFAWATAGGVLAGTGFSLGDVLESVGDTEFEDVSGVLSGSGSDAVPLLQLTAKRRAIPNTMFRYPWGLVVRSMEFARTCRRDQFPQRDGSGVSLAPCSIHSRIISISVSLNAPPNGIRAPADGVSVMTLS